MFPSCEIVYKHQKQSHTHSHFISSSPKKIPTYKIDRYFILQNKQKYCHRNNQTIPKPKPKPNRTDSIRPNPIQSERVKP